MDKAKEKVLRSHYRRHYKRLHNRRSDINELSGRSAIAARFNKIVLIRFFSGPIGKDTKHILMRGQIERIRRAIVNQINRDGKIL